MTVTFTGNDDVATIVAALRQALVDGLGATQAGCPARVVTAHGGATTLDDRDMAWLRVARIYPSTVQFGVEDNVAPPRGRGIFRWAVDVELGVVRCVAAVQAANDVPVLPDADTISGDAAVLLEDARALRAVAAYVQPFVSEGCLIRQFLPIGPAGGSGGWSMQLTVPFGDCAPTIT